MHPSMVGAGLCCGGCCPPRKNLRLAPALASAPDLWWNPASSWGRPDLVWSALSTSFFTLLSLGVFAGVVTILTVSVAAPTFPYRRPELYRNSPASISIAGVPVLPIVFVLSILVMIALAYVVLTYPQLASSYGRVLLSWPLWWCYSSLHKD